MNANNSKKVVQALAVGLTALFGVSQAGAQTQYTIGDGGLEGGFNLTMDASTAYAHTDSGALAGGILLTPVGGGTAINTVCTDVEGTVYLGQSYWYSSKTFSSPPASGLDPVWGSDNVGKTVSNLGVYSAGTDTTSAANAIQNAAWLDARYGIAGSQGHYLVNGTTTQKAALQLAIWAALYNTTASGALAGNVNTGTGRFSATGDSATLALANTLLASLPAIANQTHLAGNILLPVDPNSGNPLTGVQEMLNVTTPVPEPTTVLAGMLLLLPFGASTLRFVRNQSAA